MPRFRMTIAYDGSAFHGWQKQDRPTAGGGREPLRTVQGAVEDAVRSVVRQAVQVQGASRTDAGVHAIAQTAAFTVSDPGGDERADREPVWRRLTADRLRLAINSRLPTDVALTALAPTHDGFDPIGDCEEKGYRYTLHVGLDRPIFDRAFVHHVRTELDAERMARAAAGFVGEHDFAAFAAAGHGRLTTVRRVTACAVRRAGPTRVEIDVAGQGFLHHMVRIMAGTLVEVGRGRLTPDAVVRALASGDRRDAGPTLPACGLCLMWMRYRGENPVLVDSP